MVSHKIEPHEYKWAGKLSNRIGDPPYIVVHISASGSGTTADDIHAWHLARGFRGIGYHAVVYPNGRIVRGRPWRAMGGHTLYHNECLGVCFISKDGRLSSEQIEAGKWLIGRWRAVFGMARSRVKRHRDMSGNSTSCPGARFPWRKVVG